MTAQIGLRFHVRQPGAPAESLVVDAERALVGSAAHCEVRLGAEAAAPEHIEVVAVEGRVQFWPRVDATPPKLDGTASSGGAWPPGGVLTVGAASLSVEIVELGSRARGRSPFWLLAPVPIVALVSAVWLARERPPSDPPIPDAPPLFDGVTASCGMAPGDSVAGFAAEKLRLALAKRERGPFSRGDAVDAVPLFELAAACFKDADDDRAAEAASAASALRDKLDEEYRVRRVRVEHAYRIGDPFGARRELNVLLPMMQHRPGAYADWLGWLSRYATLEIDQRSNHGISP